MLMSPFQRLQYLTRTAQAYLFSQPTCSMGSSELTLI